MHFDTKSYLKNICNYTDKQALILQPIAPPPHSFNAYTYIFNPLYLSELSHKDLIQGMG
jgi:hypothetical protein